MAIISGKLSFGEVNTAIITGELDDSLVQLLETIKRRQRSAARRSICEGDKVVIVTSNPKYLIGAHALVEKVNQTTVSLTLDRPTGRFHRGIRCPMEWVQKVGG